MPGVLEIIVVEDHRLLRDELVDYLSSPDWHVRGVSSGRELDVAMTETPADVLVLDLNLPQEDGISIARRIRKAFPEIGIVMLTARGDQADRALGYGSGADVYLTKPTHVGELESVLFNLSCRIRPRDDVQLMLSENLLRLTHANGRSASLTNSEYRVLRLLVDTPGQELGYAPLCELLYPDDDAVSQSRQRLAVLMTRLRQKMQEEMGVEQCVKSVRGQGYRLTVPIRLVP
ncbi:MULTISPECIES: response regulator transcription factor [Brachymonas]|uniref:response regulator transcription factor n=1 Tax=Brachymonas TaxID=28219 RepID=UPI002E77B5DF|nr:response regulator transcription factor [Brachymonas sp. J145]MEE1654426.1 response regulator transcription factor [Brachymonas sp. J145]